MNNDCGVLDSKELGDFNVCGDYEGGSRATCRTPYEFRTDYLPTPTDPSWLNSRFTPSTVRTSDGLDWGNCVASTEKCGTGEVTDQPVILWCCPAL